LFVHVCDEIGVGGHGDSLDLWRRSV
jgi:hypothetical protein